MRSENLAFDARPRNGSEALDLGFAMARRWWWPLQGSWLLAAAPFALVIGLLPIDPGWKCLLFWWLKPLYEMAPLFVLSQRVFGEAPTRSECIRQWLSFIRRYGVLFLTLKRISLVRTFDLPVSLLEGQRGKTRRQRLRVLHLQGSGSMVWLTTLCANAEVLVGLSITAVLGFFISTISFGDTLMHLMRQSGLMSYLYVVGMALIAPFYVAGGFALYLNRRIELEAWDLDLVFRRLAARVAHTLLLLCCLAMVLGGPAKSWATEAPLTPSAAKSQVEKVIAGDDFHHKVHFNMPQWKGHDHQKKDAGQPHWLLELIHMLQPLFASEAGLLRLALWLLVLGVLFWCLVRLRYWLARLPRSEEDPGVADGAEVGALAASGGSESDQDIPSLIQQGDTRAAMAQLYLQVLEALNRQYGFDSQPGDTEKDWLARVSAAADPTTTAYFRDLTITWQCLAYAHQMPGQGTLTELYRRWRSLQRPQKPEVTP